MQGWKAVEGEKAAIEVLDDKGEPVKTEVTFFLRPDVVKRYPAYAVQADELGFRVKLDDLENFIKAGKGIKILLKAGNEEKLFWKEMQQSLKKAGKQLPSSIMWTSQAGGSKDHDQGMDA